MTELQKKVVRNFTIWLTLALVFGWIDHVLHSNVFLLTYFLVAAVVIVATERKRGTRRYRFKLVKPGLLRSPEVLKSRLQLPYCSIGKAGM